MADKRLWKISTKKSLDDSDRKYLRNINDVSKGLEGALALESREWKYSEWVAIMNWLNVIHEEIWSALGHALRRGFMRRGLTPDATF